MKNILNGEIKIFIGQNGIKLEFQKAPESFDCVRLNNHIYFIFQMIYSDKHLFCGIRSLMS